MTKPVGGTDGTEQKGTCQRQWVGHIGPHAKQMSVCVGWQPLPARSPTEPVQCPKCEGYGCIEGVYCDCSMGIAAKRDAENWRKRAAQSPTEPKYTNRHGDPCSQACGEGRHQDCTETYQTCHCTYRGLHKTMHAYLSSPVAQSPVPAGPEDASEYRVLPSGVNEQSYGHKVEGFAKVAGEGTKPELLDEVLEILLYCGKYKKSVGYLAAEVARLINKHSVPTSVEAARPDVASPEFYSKRGPQCPTCGNFRDTPHTCTDSFHAARETMTAIEFYHKWRNEMFDKLGIPRSNDDEFYALDGNTLCEFAEAYLAKYLKGE